MQRLSLCFLTACSVFAGPDSPHDIHQNSQQNNQQNIYNTLNQTVVVSNHNELVAPATLQQQLEDPSQWNAKKARFAYNAHVCFLLVSVMFAAFGLRAPEASLKVGTYVR